MLNNDNDIKESIKKLQEDLHDKLESIKKKSKDNIWFISYYRKYLYEHTLKHIIVIRALINLQEVAKNRQRKFNNYVIMNDIFINGSKYKQSPKKSDSFYENPYSEFYKDYIE